MDLAPVHPILAQAAVDDFLDNPNWRTRSGEYGWTFSRPYPLTLVATLPVRVAGSVVAHFTLRLSCEFCPTYPPDVRFVNPQTLDYDPACDLRHLANVQAPFCYVHPVYPYNPPYRYGPQLVCSSMILGYYVSGHNPTADQRWDPQRHTIGASIYTVHRALHSVHYRGRHSS